MASPKDRFVRAHRESLQRKRRSHDEKKQLAEAERMNSQGSYLCARCGLYWPEAEFEYEHDGQTKVARRCESCRRPWIARERDRKFSALDDPMDSTVYRVLVKRDKRRNEMAVRRQERRTRG